jgi:hypothetical protein
MLRMFPGLVPLARLEERQPGTHWHLLKSCAVAAELPAAALLTWIMAGQSGGLFAVFYVTDFPLTFDRLCGRKRRRRFVF